MTRMNANDFSFMSIFASIRVIRGPSLLSLCFLRFLLWDDLSLTEDNEGNEVQGFLSSRPLREGGFVVQCSVNRMDASLLEELIAKNKPFKIETASGRLFEVPHRDS